MKRWIFAIHCSRAGFDGGDCRIESNKAGRASGARPGGDVSRDGSKTVPGSPKQPRGHSPATLEFAGEHRGGRQTLRHRLLNVSWIRQPYTLRLRSVDLSARLRSYLASGATLLRSRIVLDCEKWNSFEWDARVWKSRIRGPHLEFGELYKNYAGKRPSEERTRPIGAEKSLLMLQGFVFKSSSHPAKPLP